MAKQAMLLALRHANSAALDGNRDQQDVIDLATAYEHISTAKGVLEQLRRRLDFHIELEHLAKGASDESSRFMLSIVRRGVDGGYQVEEVRRMVDEALGRT